MSSFNIYQPELLQVTQYVRKHIRAFKKKTMSESYIEAFNQHVLVGETNSGKSELFGGNKYITTINFNIHVREWKWLESDKKIIFLEKEMMLNLLKSNINNFNISNPETIVRSLPFDKFILALEKDIEIDNVKMVSCLVDVSYERDTLNSMKHIINKLGIKDTVMNMENENDLSLSFIFRSNDGSTCMQNICLSQIPLYLEAKTPSEYYLLREKFAYPKAKSLNEDDSFKSFYLLKTILMIAIYNNATDYKNLVAGLPNNKATANLSKEIRTGNNLHTLKTNKPKLENNNGKMFIRGWFFRNLKADKYYKGEYSDLEKGSRWTIVSECVVGAKNTDNYTQK